MRDLRKHLIILIAYTAIAVVMTLPLALNFSSAIPGLEGDATSFVWALGWAKTALVDLRVNPFHADYVFYPLGGATQLLWAVSLIAFISIPLQYLFGLIATHNILYLAATVVTAYGTFLLADEILQSAGESRQQPPTDASLLPPFQTFLVIQFVLEARRRAARRAPLAPFVAGLVFAFAPLRLGYGLSFFNLFNTQLIPFYVLFLLCAIREQSWRNAVVAGVLLGLNAYIDFQIAAFLVLFTGLYVVYRVTLVAATTAPSQPAPTKPRFPADKGRLGEFLVAASTAVAPAALIALVSLLIAAPMLAIVANDLQIEGGDYIRVFPIKYSTDRSYDLLSYFVPNAWDTLYTGVPKIPGVNAGVNSDDVSALSPDRQAFVGYIVLVLAAYAAVTRWRDASSRGKTKSRFTENPLRDDASSARFWFLVAITFALFSLGPSLHILGRDMGIPLPYLALHEIPIVNHIRIPMRYGIMVSFALALLAALAINSLQKRITPDASRLAFYALRFTLLFLPLLILFEYAILPYPIQALPVPRVYETIARVPGDFTVLEIPSFHWRYAAATEVYQAIHGKRILRAYTNRIAPGPAEYLAYRGTPIVVRSLRILEGFEKGPLTPEEIAEDKRVRDDVVRFFNLRYAVLHRSYLKADQADTIDAYMRDVLNARVISDEGDTVAYEIPRAPQPSGGLTIDLRENIGQMYAGRGWQFQYPPENFDSRFNFVWTRGTQSEIYFVLDDGRDRVMTINAYADPPQRVIVLLNGERVGELTLSNEWKDYRVVLPARALHSGMNRIALQYGAELKETIGVTMITIDE